MPKQDLAQQMGGSRVDGTANSLMDQWFRQGMDVLNSHLAHSQSITFHKKVHQTHNYTRYESGVDYVFEVNTNDASAYMTAYGRGVQQSDYILIKQGQVVERYQVADVGYYASPADMWTAHLVKA